MEKLLESQDGVIAILATLIVVFCLHLLMRVGEFLWKIFSKKEEISEKAMKELTEAMQMNTRSLDKLESRIAEVEEGLLEVRKLKKDLRRFYAAIKILAGDEWAAIREAITEDELTHG